MIHATGAHRRASPPETAPPDEPELTILQDLAEREEYEAALVLAKRALRTRPDNPKNHQIVVMLLANTQNRDEALLACDRTLERWPDDPHIRGLCQAVAERSYLFRCIPVQPEGHGWKAEERDPSMS
jgi:tetratricopeptide (TPR) repeat protein